MLCKVKLQLCRASHNCAPTRGHGGNAQSRLSRRPVASKGPPLPTSSISSLLLLPSLLSLLVIAPRIASTARAGAPNSQSTAWSTDTKALGRGMAALPYGTDGCTQSSLPRTSARPLRHGSSATGFPEGRMGQGDGGTQLAQHLAAAAVAAAAAATSLH
jgi:hypothetical protein